MKGGDQFEILKEATLLLLNCGEEPGLMKEAVDTIHAVFSSFSSVDITNHNDKEIILDSGKAISPAEAAQCLFDFKRTTKFIRAINCAIQQKLNEIENCIQILYAGCGPYATLIVPLLTLYNKGEISVDLLDINEISLLSSHQVIEGLGLREIVGEFLLEDASQVVTRKEYDIIISETMQAALRSEPQVAIMQNLMPQMKHDSIFIPEEITIDAKLNTKGNWNPAKLQVENEQRIIVGEVLKVNSETIKDVFNTKILSCPVVIDELYELKLYTSIKLYDDIFLLEGDSGLATPIKLTELCNNMGGELAFNYVPDYPAHINFELRNLAIQKNINH